MAFLALVALRATLTADSPAVTIDDPISYTAATYMALTDTDSPAVLAAADSTANDDVLALFDDTTSDNSEVMAPPAKRQRTNTLQDSNGNLVTLAHLSEVCGPFPFLMPQMVPTLLRRTFGHQFALDDADLPEFLETLQTTKGFKSLTINVETMDSGVTASLDLVHRDGPELAKVCKHNLGSDLEADLDTNLDADLDPNGTFAVEMLRNSKCYSRILLGIHVNELKVLLTYLPELMKEQGKDLVKRLTKLINSYFTQL
ncbi:hypothetical protein GGI17_006170 [Coemansia sp. S146]|nr:hypothetical protein GGI17_006170 [Coemansia sp. S146]